MAGAWWTKRRGEQDENGEVLKDQVIRDFASHREQLVLYS